MDSESEIMFEFNPYFKVDKDGRIEKLLDDTDVVPAGTDPDTGVFSKDVKISTENEISARIFMPIDVTPDQKLPLLVYYHGGGFVVGSPFFSAYHNFISALVKEAKIVAVSVDYRLAPENPLPAAFEDAWEAMEWVASHADGSGPETVLNEQVEWARVFIGGDCVGATLSYGVLARATEMGQFGANDDESKLRLVASIFVHPYFLISLDDDKPIVHEKHWTFLVPPEVGSIEDPSVNPSMYPNLGKMIADKSLICVAEKDELRDVGVNFHKLLVTTKIISENEFFDLSDVLNELANPNSSKKLFETEGESHVFHLLDPNSDNAVALLNRIASFITE